MIPLVGFVPASDERVRGTVAAVRRYSTSEGGEADGLPTGEGALLACTFWLVDNLALAGRHPEARTIFERLLALRNDVGLFAREYDSVAKRLVGDFPQAFSTSG